MNKIISILGTNGSGKSYLVRQLMNQYACKVLEKTEKDRPLSYYLPDLNLVIFGDYRDHLNAPGVDAVKSSVAEILNYLLIQHTKSHVLFEGVIAATTYGRYAELSRSFGPGVFVWVFLTTPLEECLWRIYARNGGKPIKENLVENKLRMISTQPTKARAQGDSVYEISSEWEAFAGVLGKEGILI